MGAISSAIKPYFTIPDKEINFSTPDRLAIVGATTILPVLGLRYGFGKPFKQLGYTALSGMMGGALLPGLTNKLIRYKQQKDLESMKGALKEMYFPKKDIGQTLSSLHNTMSKYFNKEASLAGAALKGIGLASRGAWGGAKAFGRGLKPISKQAPVGEKIFGAVAKGTAIGGLGYGAYRFGRFANQKRENNYTSMLRNNILAGKVSPQELNPNEMTSVRKLGI